MKNLRCLRFITIISCCFFVLPLQAQSTTLQSMGIDERINAFLAPYTLALKNFVLHPISLGGGKEIPIVIVLLLMVAAYFTFYFKFINLRKFKLAVDIVRGKHSSSKKPQNAAGETIRKDNLQTIQADHIQGEISHFQALTAAISATVGLGNIAGVAVAIALGGPGATFWMIIGGLLGMSTKFVECTLGVKYREVDEDNTVHGGPMYYLTKGLKEKGFPRTGKAFGIFFAMMCVGGSFGGGNMFQSNQAAEQFTTRLGIESGSAGFIFGLFMASLVAIVIIGGIKRIGAITEKIVPVMCGLYILSAVIILVVHVAEIPSAFALIFKEAFSPSAAFGGIVGVLAIGFQRAAFSNEAGVGSAAIAHAAVKTNYPASEGIVALLEPFIDTVVVCTMTALVIIITGVYVGQTGSNIGIQLTSQAFDTVFPGFSYVLMVAVILFAFSTMLAWSYYGLTAWKFLFGKEKKSALIYKTLFCLFIVIGSSAELEAVIDFSDAMVFAMVFPNIIGLVLLAPVVKEEVEKYVNALNR